MSFAKMPEEPPQEVKDSDDTSAGEGSGTDADNNSSSSEDSESEAKRANQLSYLHEQVRGAMLGGGWKGC